MTRFFSQVILEEVGRTRSSRCRRRRCPERRERGSRCSSLGAAVLVGCDWQHVRPPRTSGRPPGLRSRVSHRVQVTVVDGDTHRRVRGARVTIGTRSASQRPTPRRRTRAAAAPRRARHGRRKARLRERAVRLAVPDASEVDDPHLPPCAAVGDVRRRPAAHAGAGPPPRPAALPRRLVARARRARRVPGRGRGRGRLRRERARNDPRARHARRHRDLASRHTAREDGVVAGGVGDELVVHGMDGHVWVLRRTDGQLLWHYTSARRSSRRRSSLDGVDVFGAWNGTITALDLRTHRVRWRSHDGLQDHLVGGVRGRHALPRRLLRPAARAARVERPAALVAAPSTAASTARRPSRAGACSCRARPAAR